MGAVPLQRTKAWFEDKGWHCWIVEHFNPWSHTRQDMYGFADLTAIRHDSNGVWAVNACQDNGEVQAHVDKYINGWVDVKKGKTYGPNPHLPVWLAAGNRFSIFGWGKRGGVGKRKTWTLRAVEFYLNGPEVKWREVTEDPVELP